jgi:hypothetical protein
MIGFLRKLFFWRPAPSERIEPGFHTADQKPPQRKRRTSQEMEIARRETAAALKIQNRNNFEKDRAKAIYVGSKTYRWRGSGSDDCAVCQRNEGKLFRWNVEPPNGHAGCCTTCPEYCMCYAEAVLK